MIHGGVVEMMEVVVSSNSAHTNMKDVAFILSDERDETQASQVDTRLEDYRSQKDMCRVW